MKKTVCGIGYNSRNKIFNELHKLAYQKWIDILNRCYSKKSQEKNKSYVGCSVDYIWHDFDNFLKWFELNYIDGFQLDKDILLKGNKIYGPEYCCFVPKEINLLLTNSKSKRNNTLLGVTKYKNKFKVNFTINKKYVYGQYFDDEFDAFLKYKELKENHIKEVAEKWKFKISEKCYNSLINWEVNIND
jgi:hypothetical protein